MKTCRYNSKRVVLPLIELALKYTNDNIRRLSIETIPWASIANKLRRRSLIDCKNKFMQLFEYAIKRKEFDDRKIV